LPTNEKPLLTKTKFGNAEKIQKFTKVIFLLNVKLEKKVFVLFSKTAFLCLKVKTERPMIRENSIVKK
jgi:hypothetical protein